MAPKRNREKDDRIADIVDNAGYYLRRIRRECTLAGEYSSNLTEILESYSQMHDAMHALHGDLAKPDLSDEGRAEIMEKLMTSDPMQQEVTGKMISFVKNMQKTLDRIGPTLDSVETHHDQILEVVHRPRPRKDSVQISKEV